jgi:hypothetical protein
VRFLQSAGDAGLALHPLAKYRVIAEFGGHHLDGDGPFFDGVLGLVDLAHRAAAQQPLEVVGPERRPHTRALRVAHRCSSQLTRNVADTINTLRAEAPAANVGCVST